MPVDAQHKHNANPTQTQRTANKNATQLPCAFNRNGKGIFIDHYCTFTLEECYIICLRSFVALVTKKSQHVPLCNHEPRAAQLLDAFVHT